MSACPLGEKSVSGQDGKDNQMFLLIGIVLVLFVVIPAVYAMYAGTINKPLLALAQWEIWPFQLSDEAKAALARLAEIDPSSLDWERMEMILSYAGSWLRWPCVIVLAVLALWSSITGSVDKLKRKFNMESLLTNNVKNFPCLAPIVGKGKYLTSPDSYDRGLWKIARSPVQFALENEIMTYANGESCPLDHVLYNGLSSIESKALGQCAFVKSQAKNVLRHQLGERFTSFINLSPVRKTIVYAFVQYALGNKKHCMEILDAVSVSYREKDGKAYNPLLADADFIANLNKLDGEWKGFSSNPAIARHLAFELPLIMAILNEARKKGVLASSQFLWLRPMDRPLWYALNQCGGRAAWPEGLAAWAHYQAEELEKATLDDPHIESAISSLEKTLGAQGWFMDYFDPDAAAAKNFEQEISLQTVIAPAEDDEDE